MTIPTLKNQDAYIRNNVPVDNPYVARKITLFEEDHNRWGWFDDTNITLFSRRQLRGVVDDSILNAWEYTLEGQTYDLPKPLTISWEQHTSKDSNRPYKQIKLIASGDAETGEVTARLSDLTLVPRSNGHTDLLPEVAAAPEDALKRLLPGLAEAKRQLDAATAMRQRLFEKHAAISRQEHPDWLEMEIDAVNAETQAQQELAALVGKAEKLLALHSQAGFAGRVLDGAFTLKTDAQTVLRPRIGEAHLLRWLMLNASHLLRQVVQIDLNTLGRLIAPNGRLLTAFQGLPVVVEYSFQEAPTIEWERILSAHPVIEAPSDVPTKESAGEPSPERFPEA